MKNPYESIEQQMRDAGWQEYILGCDEVGRGPLAGPVTAACVAFPNTLGPDFELFALLDDSKKLSAKKRDMLVDAIHTHAAAYAVVDISPEEIDRLNILQASLEGMKRAALAVAEQLGATQTNAHIIIDGNKLIPRWDWAQTAYVKGDARSWSIAAASILAKVHRDNLMVEYDAIYPGYGFAQNVGYPTAAHRAALVELGPTPIHRKSFKVKQ
jgi:ribonuclease HII